MLLMLACGALLIVGIALAWRWRHYTLKLPEWAARNDGDTAANSLRGLVWLLGVALLTGLLVGVLVVGPAGRLAMRLLAATSPEAQGQISEAGEVVGEITLDGTIGFFVFVGLPFGLAVGLAYALTSFVLPRGVVGGAVFGTVVLVVFGSTVDPLRADNPDFDIVGPGWLSIATFATMAVLTGVLTAPIAGRIGSGLERPTPWWAAWMAPVGLVAVTALSSAPAALAAVTVGCVAFVAALLLRPERRTTIWRRGRRVLQGVLAVGVLVTVPGFASAVSSIGM